MLDLMKVARVLEAAADHFDAVEAAKVAADQHERQSQISKLATVYAETTGEEMPETIRQKLAASDKDIVSLVNSMVQKHAGRVESLGSPSDLDDEPQVYTKKEASAAAEDKFLNWIVS